MELSKVIDSKLYGATHDEANLSKFSIDFYIPKVKEDHLAGIASNQFTVGA